MLLIVKRCPAGNQLLPAPQQRPEEQGQEQQQEHCWPVKVSLFRCRLREIAILMRNCKLGLGSSSVADRQP
jgi:hypothetical protein